jgi:hypothetical protein
LPALALQPSVTFNQDGILYPVEQRSPRASTRRNAKRFDIPETKLWRTLHAQGMKEMVDGVLQQMHCSTAFCMRQSASETAECATNNKRCSQPSAE